MSLGLHFALKRDESERLLAIGDPDELVDFITEELEERYLSGDHKWVYQSDKAWDAIHRCLTDGQLLYESGPFPLAYAVLGGQALDAGDDYTACLVQPAHLSELRDALRQVSREALLQRYQKLSDTDYAKYQELSDADFEYTWSHFDGLREFFDVVAGSERFVLFTTDC